MKKTKIYKWLCSLMERYRKTQMYQKWVELKRKLKPMTWRQRLDFFWSYYRDIVSILLVLSIIPVSLIYTTVTKKDVLIAGYFVNLDLRKAGLEYITDELMVELEGDPKTQKVEVSSITFAENSPQPEYNYNMAMSVFGAIDADVCDYLLLNTYALEFYMGDLIYMDLRLIFTEDELAEMGENVIYLLDDETLERTPVALNVSEMGFVKDCVAIPEKDAAYLTFVGPFEEADQYRDLWEYLMDWQGMPEDK